DAVTGRSLLVLKHNLGVGAVAFSPDGRRVVTGTQYGDQGEARLWGANTGEELLTLKDAKFVSRVEFSPDGTRIVTSCADHIPKVWDAATGQVLFVLKGHTHDVYSVTYSRDGQRIATGS